MFDCGTTINCSSYLTSMVTYLDSTAYEVKKTWTFNINATGTKNTFQIDEEIICEHGYLILYTHTGSVSDGQIAIDQNDAAYTDFVLTNGSLSPLLNTNNKRFMVGLNTEMVVKSKVVTTSPKSYNYPGSVVIVAHLFGSFEFSFPVLVTDSK